VYYVRQAFILLQEAAHHVPLIFTAALHVIPYLIVYIARLATTSIQQMVSVFLVLLAAALVKV
jgi:hypothetical protein